MKGYTNYSGVDISRECVEYVKDHITPNVTYAAIPWNFCRIADTSMMLSCSMSLNTLKNSNNLLI